MCDVRRGSGYPKQIEWLRGYLWNRYKLKLVALENERGRVDVLGALQYTIKPCQARRWIGRCEYAPDDAYEETGIVDLDNLRKHAWRELINKIESDMGEVVALDPPPKHKTINTTHNENGKQNNERIGSDRGDRGRINETPQLGLF